VKVLTNYTSSMTRSGHDSEQRTDFRSHEQWALDDMHDSFGSDRLSFSSDATDSDCEMEDAPPESYPSSSGYLDQGDTNRRSTLAPAHTRSGIDILKHPPPSRNNPLQLPDMVMTSDTVKAISAYPKIQERPTMRSDRLLSTARQAQSIALCCLKSL